MPNSTAEEKKPEENNSEEKQPAAKPSRQSNSPIFAIVAMLIVLAIAVTGVVLAANDVAEVPDGPTPTPTPTPGPTPHRDFIREGAFFFYDDNHEYNDVPANTAFIEGWEDIEAYFDNNPELLYSAESSQRQFDFDNHRYLLVRARNNYCNGDILAVGITKIAYGTAQVLVEQNGSCGVCAPEFEYWLIKVDGLDLSSAGVSYSTINSYECDPDVAYKPIIYLYPEEETKVSVKLGAKEKLLVSYPKYIDGWDVIARPDGKLTDLQTGRNLYSLYYEADNTTTTGIHEDGFVVKGSDTIEFLEDKLAQLGLNETEAEEFIVYWLPQMQNNAYNYIYFAIGDKVAANMPLEVSPAPVTSIRINMEWKALDAPIEVKEQKLPVTPAREGFTLVEWGGTILK